MTARERLSGGFEPIRAAALARAYLAGWLLVRRLPYPLVAAAFRGFADVAWLRAGKGVRRLEANLARVLVATGRDPAGARRLARAGMRSYARYWLEVFRLPAISSDEVVERMSVRDEHHLRDPLAAGRGVILALPHTGNWDHAGAYLVATGVKFATVAERLRPEELFDRFVAFRESLGMEVVPLTGGDRSPFRVLSQRLRDGGCVCLLADRDLTDTGIDVQFFGSTARMPAGPAALAVSTGAALLPVSLWYPPDGSQGWRAKIHPEIVPPVLGTPEVPDRRAQLAAMTQAMADAFADAVAEHPADWHMLARLWLADLPVRPGGEG